MTQRRFKRYVKLNSRLVDDSSSSGLRDIESHKASNIIDSFLNATRRRPRGSVQNLGNAMYECDFTCFREGNYKVAVLRRSLVDHINEVTGEKVVLSREEHISGSPFRLAIKSAAIMPSHCEMEGPGLFKTTCKVPSRFSIVARDAFENRVRVGGAKVEAFLIADRNVILDAPGMDPAAAALAQALSHAESSQVTAVQERVDCKVEDHDDGTYTCKYKVSSVGMYRLNVLVDGIHLKQSPAGCIALPIQALTRSAMFLRNSKKTDAEASFARGRGSALVQAGLPSSFTGKKKNHPFPSLPHPSSSSSSTSHSLQFAHNKPSKIKVSLVDATKNNHVERKTVDDVFDVIIMGSQPSASVHIKGPLSSVSFQVCT
jgi:hypothetical protein